MDLVTVIRRVQRKKAEREQQRANAQAFCLLCQKQTSLVTVEEAIKKHRLTLDEISQSVADGILHRVHNLQGEILFCQNSIESSVVNSSAATQPMRTAFLRSLRAAA